MPACPTVNCAGCGSMMSTWAANPCISRQTEDTEGSLRVDRRVVCEPVGLVHAGTQRPARRSLVCLSSQRPALRPTQPAQDDSHGSRTR
jgi:hypothetical protein